MSIHDPIHPETVVFDWENTFGLFLYRQDMNGAQLPVAEIESWQKILAALQKNYQLIVVSSSLDSDPAAIQNSLDVLNLAQYFERIFTRPQWKHGSSGFLEIIQEKLSASRNHFILVGVDYSFDVLEPYQAGWRSIWYNRDMHACPGLTPLHNAEIYQISDLPNALARPGLPSWDICLAWLLAESCPQNLLLHVQTVAASAYQMAIWLKARGEDVSPLLAQRGGLLHDLAKLSPSRKNFPDMDHGSLGASILEDKNQPELAEIAFRHMIFSVSIPERKPRTWEEKLVYYADKIVEWSRVVSLEERLEALKNRYQRDNSKFLPAILDIQAEICGALLIDPRALVQGLQEAVLKGADH